MEMRIDKRALIGRALGELKHAYAPYSGFRVAAALLCEDGTVYTGVNVENASYPAGNCAERTAIFKAVSEGEKDFAAICIVNEDAQGNHDYCPPCGVCRQVMMEFCDPGEFTIILAKDEGDYQAHMLAELLPLGFGPGNLKKQTDDDLVD